MNYEEAFLYQILKDSTRQKIILQLYREGPLAYVDLMHRLKISNTGKFNYHLRIPADLLEKGEEGKYRLTEKGMHAAQLLLNFPTETSAGDKRVSIQDVILIGTVGFVAILLNPLILESFIGVPLVVGLDHTS
jgi:hypothetical protein